MFKLRTQWANCSTQTAYLCSLVTWTEAAKDWFFTLRGTPNEDANSQLAPSGSDSHPFKVGSVPWVVRHHTIQLFQQPGYHQVADFRTDISISTDVTKVGRTSLEVEHTISHDVEGGTGELLCKVASAIVIFSEDFSQPVPHGLESLGPECAVATFAAPQAIPERPQHVTTHSFRVRPSDVDGHGHINNVAFVGFLQNARIAALAKAFGCEGERPAGGMLAKSLAPTKSLHVRYVRPSCQEDEELTVYSWMDISLEDRDQTLPAMFFEICNADDAVLVRARSDFESKGNEETQEVGKTSKL